MTLRKSLKQAANLAVRALLITGLVFGAGAPLGASPQAGRDKKNEPQTGVKQAMPATTKPAGGMAEGIQVHGHWVLEIRNPDGTLASRSEFENSLAPSGPGVLAALLNNQLIQPLSWRIVIKFASGPDVEAVATTKLPPGPDPIFTFNTFELKGSATAPVAGTIREVGTRADSGGSARPFTQKLLDPADQKTVVPDQVIQVTVTISFS